ncbi:MAG TPA: hypothetical protein VFP71_10565 [Candidatus Angelobacter sp.]|nr:hypothetical protein [Candidatus Angelobacter sp.]
MPMATISLITLIASLALEIWLGILLFRRDVKKDFPLFVAFIAVSIPISAARLLTTYWYHAYYYVFWTSEALLILLSVSALNQVFWKTYEGFRFLWWLRLIYYGGIVLALAIAIRSAIVSPPVQQQPEIAIIMDAEIAGNMVRAGIVGIFAVMVRPMVIEFRRYAFGIVAGFGASSLGPVLAFISLSVSGTKHESFGKILSPLSYIVALIIWLRIFSLPDTEEKEWKPPIPPEDMARTVRGYIDALGFSRKKKR